MEGALETEQLELLRAEGSGFAHLKSCLLTVLSGKLCP